MAFPKPIVITNKKGGEWVVKHCLHPTALWPYSISGPNQPLIIAPNGLGFQDQVTAVTAALLLSSGRGHLYYYAPTAKLCFGWKDIHRGLKLLAEHKQEAIEFLQKYRAQERQHAKPKTARVARRVQR